MPHRALAWKYLTASTFVEKGGAGSGNFGHGGRPGHRGGSGGGGGRGASWEKVGVHGTNAPQAILNEGFSLGKVGEGSGYGGLFGVGVYIDTSPGGTGAATYGGTVLGVRIKKGLKLFDAREDVMGLYTPETNYGDPPSIAAHLKSQGYAGVRAANQMVIFDPENVEAYEL